MSTQSGAAQQAYVETPRHLERLRSALALNRGIELLTQIEAEAGTTVEHDEAGRVNYLEGLYLRAHREMFQDWKAQDSAAPGSILQATSREALRKNILTTLCANGDDRGGPPAGLFDANGYVIHQTPDTVARTLATFYKKMRDTEPFEYGNEITLDFFMASLGKLPAFKEVYPSGIDLRRLDAQDVEALQKRSSIPAIAKAFMHAMDGSRTPVLKNQPNGYGKWEKHVEYVSGIPFLSHKKGDEAFLVTVNGGLVPLQDIKAPLERYLNSDHMIADFPPITEAQIKGHLPGTESLREPGKKDIDGIPVSDKGTALFCLATNILTGLRKPHHDSVVALVEQCAGKGTPLFTLANNHGLRGKVMAAAGENPTLRRAVEIAYERLSVITQKLDHEKNEIFKGKTPVAKPSLYVSMGGAGAGKSAVKELVRAECGDNFVEASLDEFRKKSDMYKVLTAAGHHGDDYVAIEPFANTLRTWVANTAREQHINVLYDGTGIVYKPRYAKVVDDFRAGGFGTNVVAVDTPLIAPPGREAQFPVPAIKRVTSRFESEGRALPWIVVTGKHTRMAASMLDAANHNNLDTFSMFANDAGPGKHYLVTESFMMNDQELRDMQRSQKQGRLKAFMEGLALGRNDSMLQKMAKKSGGPPAREILGRNPGFNEDNVAFVVYPAPNRNRVLAVYNVERMVDTLEKGLMNPHASFEEGLLHKPASMPFYKRAKEGDAWALKLQDGGINMPSANGRH